YYYFSKDSVSYSVGDEYMWGESVLVAPVLEKGIGFRNVYLPPGNWYLWNSNESIKGSEWIKQEVTLDHIPVYVKAGGLIPLLPEKKQIHNTTEYSTSEITWHYYASATASNAVLFDDDGSSKNSLEEKDYELISATVTPKNTTHIFEFTSNGGSFKGNPGERIFHLVLHGFPPAATLKTSGKLKAEKRLNPNGETEITFTFTGKKAVLEVVQ
ncbi:MAG: DUF5110 domain-containing protein, partial [Chitinophagales bacterium]